MLTTAADGVAACDIEPDGTHFWWFEADPAGVGQWRRQPLPAGPPGPALAGLPAGRQYGIAFDNAGQRVAACVGVGDESRCYVGVPGGPAQLVAAADGYLCLVDLAPDGRLIALAGQADRATAVTVIDLANGRTHVLPGTEHRRIWALEFRPGPAGTTELLVIVDSDGHYRVGVWREEHGITLSRQLSFDSEITAHWYGVDGRVLIQHDRAGRSRLLLTDLDSGKQQPLATPPGTILDLACGPGGGIHYVWTRDGVPPRRLVVEPASADTQPEVAATNPGPSHRRELWTTQPYGRIHSFLATPPGSGPWPTILLVHGGPFLHDRDSYDPRVEMLTRAGYAVARPNYRGSTGYGPQWRRGFDHRVGLAQLEDLGAVRRHLVGLGVADPDRIGLCGYSWGGYLALLALGVEPAGWAVGLAVSPIADYPSAYRETMPALRGVDDELFGGGPDAVPDRYRAADPMTYVDRVRGPVFIAAGAQDERCPPGQIRRYAAELRRRSVPHRLMWMAGGHHASASEQTRTFEALLRYADAALRRGSARADWATARAESRTTGSEGRRNDQPSREGGELNEATQFA